MKYPVACLVVLCCAAGIFADTPMDAPLKEGGNTRIECSYAKNEPRIKKDFHFTPDKGSSAYDVRVPTGYAANPERRYPCFFFLGAGVNKVAQRRLWNEEWIIIQSKGPNSGKWEKVAGSFLAIHDDAVKRLRIQEGMKYATGCSAGARASSWLACMRPGFGGVFLQAAGWGWIKGVSYIYGDAIREKRFAVFASFGDKDRNIKEIEWLRQNLPKDMPYTYEVFQGGHNPAPAEVALHALDWFEEQLFFALPSKQEMKPLYARIFKKKAEGLDTLGSDFEKYLMLAKLDKLATRHALQGQAGMKDVVADVRARLKKLASDQAVAREKRALSAYERVEKREADTRKRKTGKSLKRALKLLGASYKSVAAGNKNTIYGKKAAEKVEALKK